MRGRQSIRSVSRHLPKRFILGLICLCLFSLAATTLLLSEESTAGTAAAKLQESGAGIVRLMPDHLFDIELLDDQNGIASGYYGTIARTFDGGKHWTYHNSGTSELLRRLAQVSSEKIWAVGHRGSIFHSGDGGQNWVSQHQEVNIYLRDIAFADQQTGWAVGHEATILHTSDGGSSWQKQALEGYKGRDLPRLNALVVIDSKQALVAGEFGVIALTRDGGQHWQVLESPTRTTLTAAASIARQNSIVIVGLDGEVLRIQLADKRIEKINSNTRENLFDISLNEEGNGVIVGNTVLLNFVDHQVVLASAEADIELPFKWFHGVKVTANGIILAVGLGGEIIRAASLKEAFKRISPDSSRRLAPATTQQEQGV